MYLDRIYTSRCYSYNPICLLNIIDFACSLINNLLKVASFNCGFKAFAVTKSTFLSNTSSKYSFNSTNSNPMGSENSTSMSISLSSVC